MVRRAGRAGATCAQAAGGRGLQEEVYSKARLTVAPHLQRVIDMTAPGDTETVRSAGEQQQVR